MSVVNALVPLKDALLQPEAKRVTLAAPTTWQSPPQLWMSQRLAQGWMGGDC